MDDNDLPSGGHSPTPEAWAVLGLPLDATRGEAQRAFRRLAKQTHPDAGGDPTAFRAVAGAWAHLGAVLPPERPAVVRRRSPFLAAYQPDETRVVWAERRPRPAPRRPTFASIFEAELARMAS